MAHFHCLPAVVIIFVTWQCLTPLFHMEFHRENVLSLLQKLWFCSVEFCIWHPFDCLKLLRHQSDGTTVCNNCPIKCATVQFHLHDSFLCILIIFILKCTCIWCHDLFFPLLGGGCLFEVKSKNCHFCESVGMPPLLTACVWVTSASHHLCNQKVPSPTSATSSPHEDLHSGAAWNPHVLHALLQCSTIRCWNQWTCQEPFSPLKKKETWQLSKMVQMLDETPNGKSSSFLQSKLTVWCYNSTKWDISMHNFIWESKDTRVKMTQQAPFVCHFNVWHLFRQGFARLLFPNKIWIMRPCWIEGNQHSAVEGPMPVMLKPLPSVALSHQ